MFINAISYDEFDGLCELMQEYPVRWVPTDDEIKEMKNLGMTLFLALIANILEHNENLSSEERQQIKKLNKIALNEIEFTDDKAEHSGTKEISFSTYQRVIALVKNANIEYTEWDLSNADFKEAFVPYIKYSFALFVLIVYRKPKTIPAEAAEIFREMVRENYSLTGMEEAIEISKDEYEKLYKSILGLKLEKDHWWPTIEQVEDIIKPNLPKCYDFVIWMLEKGDEPINQDDIEVVKMLRHLIKTHLKIRNEGELIW